MNSRILSILLIFAGLFPATEALSQDTLSTFKERTARLPRYNFWVDGTLVAAPSMKIVKAPSDDYEYDAREWQLGVSGEYYLGKWDIFKNSRLSFYIGGKTGFRYNVYSDTDRLTLKPVMIAPGYVQAGAFGSIQFSPYRNKRPLADIQAGYVLDALVMARIDSEAKQLTGYNRDCMTPLVNTVFWGAGVFFDRIRIGFSMLFRLNPPLSTQALEYYKGAQHSITGTNIVFGFNLSVLLGGTDK